MKLITGRTAEEYNQRKKWKGLFWENRYHATAVNIESYLLGCMVYIDLNVVRAGVALHPEGWHECGYDESQSQRYAVIDRRAMLKLFAVNRVDDFH